MGDIRREFIINDLIVPGFIAHEGHEILLVESEETGKSELRMQLSSDDNLSIANVDKKKTDLLFFRQEKEKSMYKRVDHIVFERNTENRWNVHLIEMKGSVDEKKWQDVKRKFRASYLLARALAGILDMELSGVRMYTTYEKVRFDFSDTMPAARRVESGIPLARMKDEWEKQCELNLGEKVPFFHEPVKMERNENGILTGRLVGKQ